MPPAIRMMDMMKVTPPHCHAPIHPPAPVPTPAPHPGMPLMIVKGAPTVIIGGMPGATMTSTSGPCLTGGCVPAGPGMIILGSFKVLVTSLPAARSGDMTVHMSCVAPIPGPIGKCLPPGCPKVVIGG